jgi:hypothetical protein
MPKALNLKGSRLLNETEISAPKRFEELGPQGRIIADPAVILGMGRYNDAHGKGHPCVHVQDPLLRFGERRVYIVTREAALNMLAGLQRVIKETGP